MFFSKIKNNSNKCRSIKNTEQLEYKCKSDSRKINSLLFKIIRIGFSKPTCLFLLAKSSIDNGCDKENFETPSLPKEIEWVAVGLCTCVRRAFVMSAAPSAGAGVVMVSREWAWPCGAIVLLMILFYELSNYKLFTRKKKF